ncbi:MAG: hypothetical protein ACKO6E_12265 [Planctomycetota bacterium]
MTAAHTAADPDRAAAALETARRVLLTGLVGADAEVAVAACDLAEACGAAVDPGSPETSRVAGPLIARIGGVTAASGELHERADLIVAWFCAPADLLGSLVGAPRADGPTRTTILVGPAGGGGPGGHHRHVFAAAEAAVDLARLVEATIRGVAIDDTACVPATRAAARDVAAAIAAARCVGVVTDWRDDAIGLAAWSTTSLVRAIAHRKPAFEVPLGERDDHAVAVCTWRYGAAGAIEHADHDGGGFRPPEADAVRLLDRGEVDCVVVVGEATAAVAAAIDRAGGELVVVHLPADPAPLRQAAARIRRLSGVRP